MDEDSREGVVFLDGNISPNICFYWRNRRFREELHWISFFSVRGILRGRRNADPRSVTTKRMDLATLNGFFEALGDTNLLDPSGKTPGEMDDHELVDYMWELIERRYSGKRIYVFYTQDVPFMSAGNVRSAKHLEGFRVKVTVETLRGFWRDPHSIEHCSRAICHDLEKRLSWPCRCHHIYRS